ncbi:hypothetical protein F5Y05DRAFT_419368 [Hypoxylon sp. FL0543]|nr:hypothetical protein F5Y05DRAFT_419368 [Hypoxylon sp. FL0543]
MAACQDYPPLDQVPGEWNNFCPTGLYGSGSGSGAALEPGSEYAATEPTGYLGAGFANSNLMFSLNHPQPASSTVFDTQVSAYSDTQDAAHNNNPASEYEFYGYPGEVYSNTQAATYNNSSASEYSGIQATAHDNWSASKYSGAHTPTGIDPRALAFDPTFHLSPSVLAAASNAFAPPSQPSDQASLREKMDPRLSENDGRATMDTGHSSRRSTKKAYRKNADAASTAAAAAESTEFAPPAPPQRMRAAQSKAGGPARHRKSQRSAQPNVALAAASTLPSPAQPTSDQPAAGSDQPAAAVPEKKQKLRFVKYWNQNLPPQLDEFQMSMAFNRADSREHVKVKKLFTPNDTKEAKENITRIMKEKREAPAMFHDALIDYFWTLIGEGVDKAKIHAQEVSEHFERSHGIRFSESFWDYLESVSKGAPHKPRTPGTSYPQAFPWLDYTPVHA